jgi:hypothetical protein
VDPEELTAFRAADNRILELEREIGAFGGLRSIDVSPLLIFFLRRKNGQLIEATCEWAKESTR